MARNRKEAEPKEAAKGGEWSQVALEGGQDQRGRAEVFTQREAVA